MICIFKILFIFAVSSFVRVNESPAKVPGFFIAQNYSGVTLPSAGYNGLLSPDKGLDNGEGNTVFLLPVLKFINMLSKNLSSATAQSQVITPEEIIKKLFDSDFTNDLRTDLREMIDAYLLSEDETDYRDQRYSSFMWIDSLLKDIQLYQAQSQIKLVS